jgi:signal transduction histidine kinase
MVEGLLGRALLAEVQSPTFAMGIVPEGVEWWIVRVEDQAISLSGAPASIDAESLELAREVRIHGSSVMRAGVPWQAIRFAVSTGEGEDVAVARIPAVLSLASLVTLLLVDSLVFALFGNYLLRRRVVMPLRQLVSAARSIGEAGPGARVADEGVEEVRELAMAFNEMSEALEHRTNALEKAVGDLRESNMQLSQARAGLDRAERLAAVGSLAAGVAHEVGNPMGALLAFLELVDRDEGLSEAGHAHVARASQQGSRVREILRQLLDFSRPPQAQAMPVDAGEVCSQIESLVRAQRRYEQIGFELKREAGVGTLFSDGSMISQILLNLVINAADVVRELAEPRIRLTLRPAHLRARSGERQGAAAERRAFDAVECEVADNGPGIPDDDRERIFDPFFTTKPPGEGTGLGLANAQRLAEELGGTIEYAPSPDLGGAAFTLRLPLGKGSSAPAARAGIRS